MANQKSYPNKGENVFSYKGLLAVALIIYFELFFVAIEFLILKGANLDNLFPNMNIQIGSIRIGGKEGFVLLTTMAILPATWLRSLQIIAYISAGGVLALCVSIIFCG